MLPLARMVQTGSSRGSIRRISSIGDGVCCCASPGVAEVCLAKAVPVNTRLLFKSR